MTTDALLTQRAFCQKVVEAEGDYLLPVKKNQAALYEEIQTLFQYHQNNCSDDTTTPDPKTTLCFYFLRVLRLGIIRKKNIYSNTCIFT